MPDTSLDPGRLWDARQKSINLTYCALMPDGSMDCVVGGELVARSGVFVYDDPPPVEVSIGYSRTLDTDEVEALGVEVLAGAPSLRRPLVSESAILSLAGSPLTDGNP